MLTSITIELAVTDGQSFSLRLWTIIRNIAIDPDIGKYYPFNLFLGLIPRNLLREKYRVEVVDTPLLAAG
jgi:hypothetical protein